MDASPEHIGHVLRDRRMALDLTPQDVFEAIHLRVDYIRAIETLNADALPSIGYVLGYVRSYAKFLGLNADESVARYKAEIAAPENICVSHLPHFVPKNKIKLPRGFIPALGVLGFAVMLSVWYGGTMASQAANPALLSVDSQTDTQMKEAPIDPNLVTLKASAPSWVQVTDGKGKTIISRIFVTGETYSAIRGSDLTFSVRDAGAVDIYIGKENLGALGEMGQALKDVPFPR